MEFADPCTEQAEIGDAMRKTYHVRRENPTEILIRFPRFLDTPNLVHYFTFADKFTFNFQSQLKKLHFQINIDFSLVYPGVQLKNYSTNKILQLFDGTNSTDANSAKKLKLSVQQIDRGEFHSHYNKKHETVRTFNYQNAFRFKI